MVVRPRPDARHLSFISAVLRLDRLCQTLSFRRVAPGAFRPGVRHHRQGWTIPQTSPSAALADPRFFAILVRQVRPFRNRMIGERGSDEPGADVTLPNHLRDRDVSEIEGKIAVKRKSVGLRFKRVKSTARLDGVQKTIENLMGLPAGSVRFVTPKGKKVRSDARVSKLRAHWED